MEQSKRVNDEAFLLYEADREAAYKAVALALTTYRWWGWTNISNTFRTWLTVVKLRLGFKMWPGA